MKKPDYPITSEEWLDYGLAERVARHLQASPLHVFFASVSMSVPAALGDPSDPHAALLVDLTMLTDGRRGWLVLVSAQDEWDAEAELTEFVEGLCEMVEGPSRWVVRAARGHEPAVPGALDLRDAATVRERLEAEFERSFDGAPPAEVEPFLRPFEKFGYAVWDELAIRRQMNEAA